MQISEPGWGLFALGVAITAAVAAGWLSGALVRRAAHGRHALFLLTLHRTCHRPWTVVLLVTALLVASPATDLPRTPRTVIHYILLVSLIGAGAWLATRLLFIVEDTAFRRLSLDVADNRRRRRARTQISVLRRLTAVLIGVLALASALMVFEPLRTVGASLLASAGVAGIVIGLAAQTTLGHVFAGLQIAFADSLRIDDVVVVENEWGRVEEIRLTHVVLRLWDHRRLVLPTTYFTTTPFQNWTRHEARVLAEVILHLDYTARIDRLRERARQVIESASQWDHREWTLQVIDSTPWTMVVRVLASAPDASQAWDLKCSIREELIRFMRDNQSSGLPRIRAVMSDHGDGYDRNAGAGSASPATPGRAAELGPSARAGLGSFAATSDDQQPTWPAAPHRDRRERAS